MSNKKDFVEGGCEGSVHAGWNEGQDEAAEVTMYQVCLSCELLVEIVC